MIWRGNVHLCQYIQMKILQSFQGGRILEIAECGGPGCLEAEMGEEAGQLLYIPLDLLSLIIGPLVRGHIGLVSGLVLLLEYPSRIHTSRPYTGVGVSGREVLRDFLCNAINGQATLILQNK